MNTTAAALVIGIAAVVVMMVYTELRRQNAARLEQLRRKGFQCYHGRSIVDCAECKVGETRKTLSRHERRRADRHNSKVVKHMKKQGRAPWA